MECFHLWNIFLDKRLYEQVICNFQMAVVLIQIHSFKKNMSHYYIIKPKENQSSPGICILCSENNCSYISRNISLIKVPFSTQSNHFNKCSVSSPSYFWVVILTYSLYFRTIKKKSKDKVCQQTLGKTSKLETLTRTCNHSCYLIVQRFGSGLFSFDGREIRTKSLAQGLPNSNL